MLFAVSVHAHSHDARVDWRVDYDSLSYTPVEPPWGVADGIRKLMGKLGLKFATLDFTIDRDGNWFFLDLNPNGQWLWLTQHSDLPIAAALSELLAG